MKKVFGILVVLVVLLTFGIANAGDGAGVLKAAQQNHGVQGTYWVWLPLVPRYSQYKWDSVLVLSNFNNTANNITVIITPYGQSPRLFVETLNGYQKKSYGLSYFGFSGDVLADMYVTSNDVFAAMALLMDINTGEVQASLPWFANI